MIYIHEVNRFFCIHFAGLIFFLYDQHTFYLVAWFISLSFLDDSVVISAMCASILLHLDFHLYVDQPYIPFLLLSLRFEACLFNATLELQANIFLLEVVCADDFLFEFVTYENWDQRIKCLFSKSTNSKELTIFPFL